MTAQVIVLQGVSGSGKSSYCKNLASNFVFSADDYFMQSGVYKFNPAQLGDAHSYCFRNFVVYLQQWADSDKVLVVDNTGTTAVEIAPYMALAAAYNVPAKIVTIECDLELAFKRNQHNVPMKTILKQAARIKQSHSQFPFHWNHETIKAEGMLFTR